MKVHLNLATKPLETHRKFLAASGVVGVVALAFFLSFGWHVYSSRKADYALRARTAGIRQELDALHKQRTDLQRFFVQPENARLNDRAAFINTVIDERSLDWTRMFMDLEKILPAGVRVVNIEPKLDKGRVEIKLTIGAVSDEAKLQFFHALERSAAFTQVVEVSEHAPTQQNSSDRSAVDLTAVYRGADAT